MNETGSWETEFVAVRENLEKLFKEQGHELPPLLFHYTSAEGLKGILETESFWLTDLRFMNDLSELQYAQDLILSSIESHDLSNNINERQQEFLRRLPSYFSPLRLGLASYSVSFCESENLLSQWRAYRGRGGGYALGVDLLHALRFLDRHCVIQKVIYNEEQQHRLFQQALDGFLQCLAQDLEVEDENKFFQRVCEEFVSAVRRFIFTFKHPDFYEENEWRLVYEAQERFLYNPEAELPKFRTFEGNIIPYFSVSFSEIIKASGDDSYGINFPFPRVNIGPTVNGELNKISLQILMSKLAVNFEPEIGLSTIPLRWL